MAVSDLIERLKSATGPDRELDGRIWAELDGRDVRVAFLEHWGANGLLAKSRSLPRDECVVGIIAKDGRFMTVGQTNPPEEYTKSIDAALKAVPKGVEQWDVCFDTYPMACVGRGHNSAKGANPAIALCIAAFLARTQDR